METQWQVQLKSKADARHVRPGPAADPIAGTVVRKSDQPLIKPLSYGQDSLIAESMVS